MEGAENVFFLRNMIYILKNFKVLAPNLLGEKVKENDFLMFDCLIINLKEN